MQIQIKVRWILSTGLLYQFALPRLDRALTWMFG